LQQCQIDTLINVLFADVDINEKDKVVLKNIITTLPKDATLTTLIKTLRTLSAKQLGITLSTYDAIEPLLAALTKDERYGNYFNE